MDWSTALYTLLNASMPGRILLSTVLVTIKNVHGKKITLRVLLDSSTQIKFMSKKLTNHLQIQ